MGVVHPAEEQISVVVGGGVYRIVVRCQTHDVANRQRTGISKSFFPSIVEGERRPPLLDTQRGNKGEHCRKVQSNAEDTHVAVLYQTPDCEIPREVA